MTITEIYTRAIRGYLAWKARKQYDRELVIERRHMLHDMQEGA